MPDSRAIERRVAGFLDACREHGVKATHQRIEILRELARTDEHPDAETLYRRVRRRIRAMSLDTVYRTLRLFEEKGVITRVGSIKDRARFDANMDRHHHFVCTDCGLIGDFYSAALDHLAVPPEVAGMGLVDGVYVELRGRCRACQSRNQSRQRNQGGKS